MGKFITLYGINNIGKSTQAKLLVEALEKQGLKVSYLKYPIYDLKPTGPFINKVLRSKKGQTISESELQLWFILNRYQFEPTLENLIETHDVVIAEDYIGTGIAWGVAKGLSKQWLEEANKHLLTEDVCILFEGKRKLGSREKTHLHEQNDELSEKCCKILSHLADQNGWHRFKMKREIKATAADLLKLVQKLI